MTSEKIDKIVSKAKQMRFQASKGYKAHATSSLPYEQLIVVSTDYPDFIFLVNKNLHFERNSINDSSYDVISFDKEGNYVRKEDVSDFDTKFFRDMKVIKKV
jgi:hypothetical protein